MPPTTTPSVVHAGSPIRLPGPATRAPRRPSPLPAPPADTPSRWGLPTDASSLRPVYRHRGGAIAGLRHVCLKACAAVPCVSLPPCPAPASGPGRRHPHASGGVRRPRPLRCPPWPARHEGRQRRPCRVRLRPSRLVPWHACPPALRRAAGRVRLRRSLLCAHARSVASGPVHRHANAGAAPRVPPPAPWLPACRCRRYQTSRPCARGAAAVSGHAPASAPHDSVCRHRRCRPAPGRERETPCVHLPSRRDPACRPRHGQTGPATVPGPDDASV